MQRLVFSVFLTVLMIGLNCGTAAAAQRVRLDEIKYEVKDTTDRSADTKGFSGLSNMGTSLNYGWGVLALNFSTAPLWVNEMEIKYYVLLSDKKTGKTAMLTDSTSYLLVPQGEKHKAYIFMPPNVLNRFGKVAQVRAEAWYNGVLEDEIEWPNKSKQAWWTKVRPMEGYLRVKHYTPFERLAQNEELIKISAN